MVTQVDPSAAAARAVPGQPARSRVALEFAVTGDVRFLAHHDELRMLLRALVRARWPLAYSRGFNPRPHLAVPLPRSVGTAADRQLALTDLAAPRPPDELFASLARQLPAGHRLLRVVAPAPRVTPHAQTACYEIELGPTDAAGLAPRLRELLARPTVVVQRYYGPRKAARPIDIRPYIEQLQLDGPRLRLVLRCRDQRTARPSEVINELGLAAEAYNHRLRRASVQWDIELSGPEAGPAARERNYFDNQETLTEENRRRLQAGGREEEDRTAANEETGRGGGNAGC